MGQSHSSPLLAPRPNLSWVPVRIDAARMYVRAHTSSTLFPLSKESSLTCTRARGLENTDTQKEGEKTGFAETSFGC